MIERISDVYSASSSALSAISLGDHRHHHLTREQEDARASAARRPVVSSTGSARREPPAGGPAIRGNKGGSPARCGSRRVRWPARRRRRCWPAIRDPPQVDTWWDDHLSAGPPQEITSDDANAMTKTAENGQRRRRIASGSMPRTTPATRASSRVGDLFGEACVGSRRGSLGGHLAGTHRPSPGSLPGVT